MSPLRHCRNIKVADRNVTFSPKRANKVRRLVYMRDARVFEAQAAQALEEGNKSLAAGLLKVAASMKAKAMALFGRGGTTNTAVPKRQRGRG